MNVLCRFCGKPHVGFEPCGFDTRVSAFTDRACEAALIATLRQVWLALSISAECYRIAGIRWSARTAQAPIPFEGFFARSALCEKQARTVLLKLVEFEDPWALDILQEDER